MLEQTTIRIQKSHQQRPTHNYATQQKHILAQCETNVQLCFIHRSQILPPLNFFGIYQGTTVIYFLIKFLAQFKAIFLSCAAE